MGLSKKAWLSLRRPEVRGHCGRGDHPRAIQIQLGGLVLVRSTVFRRKFKLVSSRLKTVLQIPALPSHKSVSVIGTNVLTYLSISLEFRFPRQLVNFSVMTDPLYRERGCHADFKVFHSET